MVVEPYRLLVVRARHCSSEPSVEPTVVGTDAVWPSISGVVSVLAIVTAVPG